MRDDIDFIQEVQTRGLQKRRQRRKRLQCAVAMALVLAVVVTTVLVRSVWSGAGGMSSPHATQGGGMQLQATADKATNNLPEGLEATMAGVDPTEPGIPPTPQSTAAGNDGNPAGPTARPSTDVNGPDPGIQAEDLMQGVQQSSSSSGQASDAAFQAMMADFAVRLLQTTWREETANGESALVSPLSVMLALAMLQNGAAGETLAEMEALWNGIPRNTLNAYMRGYLKRAAAGGASSSSGKMSGRLHIANSIWFRQDTPTPLQAFLQANADFYGASLYRAPFNMQTVSDMNLWVQQQTGGMIDRVIDGIPADVYMYLINALSFEADWEDQYDSKHGVEKANFTGLDGTVSTVDMMYRDEWYYLEDSGASGFLKYYEGRQYAFAALLPDEDVSVSQYMETLTGAQLQKVIQNGMAQRRQVKTGLPKFQYEYTVSLDTVLQQMGMQRAFDRQNADFSGIVPINGSQRLFVDKVLHKTAITVDNLGTRAGAVTVINPPGAVPGEPPSVYLDRPFVYVIWDVQSSIPLFLGVVTQL